MKKRHALAVRGKQHEWSFTILVDPRYVAEWREDGLEIHEIYNSIPEWIVDMRLTRLWCFVQDLFHFRNPFR